jgi:hypothetical protein
MHEIHFVETIVTEERVTEAMIKPLEAKIQRVLEAYANNAGLVMDAAETAYPDYDDDLPENIPTLTLGIKVRHTSFV